MVYFLTFTGFVKTSDYFSGSTPLPPGAPLVTVSKQGNIITLKIEPPDNGKLELGCPSRHMKLRQSHMSFQMENAPVGENNI